MSVQIAVRLPNEDLQRLDAAIARGAFPSRASAVRAGLDRVLRDEREAQIEEAYRLGYGADHDQDTVGEAGLRLGSTFFAGEELADGEPDA